MDNFYATHLKITLFYFNSIMNVPIFYFNLTASSKQCNLIKDFLLNKHYTQCMYINTQMYIFVLSVCRDVLPNEKNVSHKEVFTPEKDGLRTVTVSFNSKQLTDIKNTITATVMSQ